MSGTVDEDGLFYSIYGADPDLHDVVALFITEMPDRIECLLAQSRNRDWSQLARTAHAIKGAAGTYGFDQFTPAAHCLELQVNDGRPETEILQSVAALINLCRRARAGRAGGP